MRIPVSNADLEQGRFTKISRALQKLWHLDELSLMQAQNTMATFLGYRNLHDLQGNACPVSQFPTIPALSRAGIQNAVAWKIFRRHGINFFRAADIAAGLHLDTLDIDAATSDAAFERTQEEYRQRGQLLIMDEAWQLMNPHWNPKTPQLLDAHIPGYDFAVLPNQQVFRWSLLERLLDRLPADFMEDIRQEPKYADMQGNAMEMSFVTQELLPSACESLAESVKNAKVRPDGFEIIWLFSNDGECRGRVLHNKSLGGIIPALYGVSDDGIYDAIGDLLCGKTVASKVSESRQGDSPVYTLRFFHGGYDLTEDLRRYRRYGDETPNFKPAPSDLEELPSHIGIREEDGAFSLHGSPFVERGQTYLRYQPHWLRASEILPSILTPMEVSALIKGQPGRDYLGTTDTLPETAIKLRNEVNVRLQQRFSEAASRLQNDEGVSKLNALLFTLIEPGAFDAYCNTLIDEHLPIRLEDSTEDDPDLIEERTREIKSLNWNGAAIKKAIPSLALFQDATLGMILLLANGEYPGSRYSGLVSVPGERKTKEVAEYLAAMVLHASCIQSGQGASCKDFSANVLCFAVDSVIEGKTAPTELAGLCLALGGLINRLENHEKAEKEITAWRQTAASVSSIQSTGQFLYVGKPVSREKPKTIADLYAQARSSGFAMVAAQQSLVAVSQGLDS